MSTKKVDTWDLAVKLFVAKLGLPSVLDETWDEIKEAPSGPIVSKADFISSAESLWSDGVARIEDLLGVPLPLVTEDDLQDPDPEDPEGPLFGYKYKTRVLNSGEQMSHRDTSGNNREPTKQDIFRPKGCGRNYGGNIMVIWSDGDTMIVPDAGSRHYHGAWDDKRKWQPGCGDGTTPLCEVYARVGSHPEWMDIYSNYVPSEDDTENPVDDEWKTIEWGGDPSLGWDGHDSRDRTWWTKIHGSHSTPWSRKFPLPKDVEEASSLEFEFSDGSFLHVRNPKKMAMHAGGPKYRPEEPGENDPRKQHPKVGAIPKSPVTWVRYKKG